MANKEQLDLLEQAHSALESESANSEWNRWREENPDVEIDLKNANLSNLILRRINLSGASLENADLSYAWLMNSNFRGANLTNANLTDASFTDADLRGANLTGADLTGASLVRANLRGANLTDANLTGATYHDSTYFSGANLTRTIGYEPQE